MKVGFIGVGKLGQPVAEIMAEHYNVIGYDIMNRNPENFKMSPTIKGAVEERDIVFIAVQTPHDPNYDGSKPTSHLPNKDFDYSRVIEVLDEVNSYATKDQLVVLISTVLPGTTRREFAHRITNARFIYNPYLIAMGTVKWDMVNPEMVIIGTDDGSVTGDAKILMDFYDEIFENNHRRELDAISEIRYEVGTWDEAEAIKIFYNTFISAKVSLVNMIQDVACINGNMDTDVVTKAIERSTHRITGPAYFKAGMGDGGPCHPRDNIALRWLAEEYNLGYDLFDAIMRAREVQAQNLAATAASLAEDVDLPVVVLGGSYKPGVEFTDGSSSLLTAHYIEQEGITVAVDPKTPIEAVYIIAHRNQFYDYNFPAGSWIIDPWREFPDVEGSDVIYYGKTR